MLPATGAASLLGRDPLPDQLIPDRKHDGAHEQADHPVEQQAADRPDQDHRAGRSPVEHQAADRPDQDDCAGISAPRPMNSGLSTASLRETSTLHTTKAMTPKVLSLVDAT